MKSSSGAISVVASTQRLDVDNRFSLRYYYRIADNVIKQIMLPEAIAIAMAPKDGSSAFIIGLELVALHWWKHHSRPKLVVMLIQDT